MLEKLEKKLSKFCISNLIKYVIVIQVIGFCINLVDVSFYNTYLSLNFDKILEGEIWRFLTFILYSDANSDILSMLFFSISLIFYYFVGGSLELFWGKFWFNAYFFSGIIFNIIGSFIVYYFTGINVSIGLQYVLESLFLAFAILFPELKLNLYFLFPIKIKWLGYLYFGMLMLNAVSYFVVGGNIGISMSICIIVSVLNFILFAILTKKKQAQQKKNLSSIIDEFVKFTNETLKQDLHNMKEKEHDSKENPKMKPKKTYNHKCCICGRTDADDDNLEFRYCSKCSGEHEYCSDHLFVHEHIK